MKFSPESISTLITFLVGGGLATLVTQIVRGWSSLRTGARASVREVVKDLAAARDEAEDRRGIAQRDCDYWQGVAAGYGYQLRAAGKLPDPVNPIPPSMVPVAVKRARRPRGPAQEDID